MRMGFIEKWNNLAKKKIHINDRFQISVGRIIFVALITLLQSVTMLLMGLPPEAILVNWSNALLGLEKNKEKEKNTDEKDNQE